MYLAVFHSSLLNSLHVTIDLPFKNVQIIKKPNSFYKRSCNTIIVCETCNPKLYFLGVKITPDTTRQHGEVGPCRSRPSCVKFLLGSPPGQDAECSCDLPLYCTGSLVCSLNSNSVPDPGLCPGNWRYTVCPGAVPLLQQTPFK